MKDNSKLLRDARLEQVNLEISDGMRGYVDGLVALEPSSTADDLSLNASKAAMTASLESMQLYDGVTGDKEEADRYTYWLGEFVLAMRDIQGIHPNVLFAHLAENRKESSLGLASTDRPSPHGSERVSITHEMGDFLIRCFRKGQTPEEVAGEINITLESSRFGLGDGQSRTKVICESHIEGAQHG